MTETVMVKGARLAFPKLWKAESFQGGDGPKSFGAAVAIEPTNPSVKLIEAAIKKAAITKWAGKAEAILKKLKKDGRICFQRGPKTDETGEPYDGFEGMFSLNASNKTRPLVLNRDKSPLTEGDGKPYAGCYVEMFVDIWAQDNQYGKRINASLKAVRFIKDGDAFGGGAPASADAFDDLDDLDDTKESAAEESGADDDSLF